MVTGDRLHVFDEIDSTNCYLLDWPDIGTLHGRVCLAEHQTAGRGRRGKDWHDSPGGSVMLSIAWLLDSGQKPSGLSLCVGVAIVRALHQAGIENIQLKWPNDVLWADRKLGGILVETSQSHDGVLRVIAGMGLNVRLNKNHAVGIGQPWTDLTEIQQQTEIELGDRNRLAANIVIHLDKMFAQFSNQGFAAFRVEWLQYHAHRNRVVNVTKGNQSIQGVAIGVDESGGLQIRVDDGEVKVVNSGEVSLRLV